MLQVAVVHFSNWFSFHVVDGLLSKGYNVTLINPKAHADFFLDFFARNSHLTVLYNEKDEHYDAAIWLDEYFEESKLKATKHLLIPSSDNLKPVIIFGEWMRMNKTGVYCCGHYVPFSSDSFQKQAIAVTDLVTLIVAWLSKQDFSGLYSLDTLMTDDVTPENSLLLQKSAELKKSINGLLAHYEQYALFYKQLEKMPKR